MSCGQPGNGLDYVEVSDDQLTLEAHFTGAVPPLAAPGSDDGLAAGNFTLSGGDAVTGIKVTAIRLADDGGDPEEPGDARCLALTVDRPGDFSCYRLVLGAPDTGMPGGWGPYPGIDPANAWAEFSFKAGCPSDIDCAADCAGAVAVMAPASNVNYLAKDYESFRQLILDRLAVTMPNWQERHAADFGITVVEALAYAADELSYYQDAVATEAYLGTARRRISVRRHVRLVDYQLHEGLNARAWLTVWTDQDTPPLTAADCYFITGVPELAVAPGTVVRDAALALVPQGGYRVFEPVAAPTDPLTFYAAHSEIDIDAGPHGFLPRGATSATLVDKALWRRANPHAQPPASWGDAPTIPGSPLALVAGEVLILEEVRGPATGNPADADPSHRQAVRLTQVVAPADGGWLVEIAWGLGDALTFPLCVCARQPFPDCETLHRLSVARGNVVLVDHGRTVADPPWPAVPTLAVTGDCACEGSVLERLQQPRPINPALLQAPVTFADTMTFADTVRSGPAAAALAPRDPRTALPAATVSMTDPDTGAVWTPRLTLLESNRLDTDFVVEVDDAGTARLRFGDGDLGAMPGPGQVGTPAYRVGNGTAGNVGRDSISFLVLRNQAWSGFTVKPRNPLPATGGTDPEPVAEARLLAPNAFRQTLLRAVTAADYAALAGQDPALQRAAAALRWTGSWYEARVGIDPLGTQTPPTTLLETIATALAPYRRMGHDLAVVPAAYVPVDVELSVCAGPHHLRGDIRAALSALLGNKALPGGGLGFFHPDRLTFGGSIYASALVAAAASVPGVESATVTRLQRLGAAPNHELDTGALTVGPMEIVRLDNSPNHPENGKLNLVIGGGL